jgi:hypothetical protein
MERKCEKQHGQVQVPFKVPFKVKDPFKDAFKDPFKDPSWLSKHQQHARESVFVHGSKLVIDTHDNRYQQRRQNAP